MVGDYQRVLAQRRAGDVAVMGEVVKQTFLGHQPLAKSQVAFLVLDAQAALGIAVALQDVVMPCRRQLALLAVGAKHMVEDVEYRHVLEHAAVAAMRQEGGPRLQRQVVARESPVRAGQFDRSEMAVEGPCLPVAGSEQFKQRRLADQAAQGNLGVAR